MSEGRNGRTNGAWDGEGVANGAVGPGTVLFTSDSGLSEEWAIQFYWRLSRLAYFRMRRPFLAVYRVLALVCLEIV